MNPKNTPFEIKRLLGRRFNDPQLQRDMQRMPFKVRGLTRVPPSFDRGLTGVPPGFD